LAEQRVVAAREVSEAAAVLAAAKASVVAAESELAALGSGAESGGGASMNLRAPVSGVVLERRAVLGRFVEAGEMLFRVGELSRVWVTVHAFERDAVRVNVGSTAEVILPAFPGREFAGSVTLVGTEVEAASRTLPVRIEVANPDGLLKPGMSVTARLVVGTPGDAVLVVPAVSLQRLHNDWVVFIPRGETAFEARQVGRGRDLGNSVEVLSGLTAGETVVVDGAFLLKAEAEKASGGGEEHEH
jgi:cobalt-zinc-cadmium efflux system membrane fusion protein